MKYFTTGMILMLLVFIPIFFAIDYEKKHYCDNPYKEICVKSHTHTTMVMVPMMVGKITTMRAMPIARTICDEKETILKDKCKSNK
jgi:hypothetical protein